MIRAGQIILFRFPATDQTAGKLRPALVLKRLPGPFDDWLICMISSQLGQQIPGFDEVVQTTDAAFAASGLKVPSLIRAGRLAVVQVAALRGAIGQIASGRLSRITAQLGQWIAAN